MQWMHLVLQRSAPLGNHVQVQAEGKQGANDCRKIALLSQTYAFKVCLS